MNVVVAAAVVALLGTAASPRGKPDPRDSGPNEIDVSRYPPQQQKNYELFSAKCGKCHPLARAINSRFSAEEWKRYIDRMVRLRSTGISEAQAAQIYDFLAYSVATREPKAKSGSR